VGLDPHKYVYLNLISNEDLESVFGKRGHNGWKMKVNENLTITSCFALLKLYEVVYAHLPLNGDYPIIFLCGWLAYVKMKEWIGLCMCMIA